MGVPVTKDFLVGNVLNIEKWFEYHQKLPEGYGWIVENVKIKNIPKINRPNWKWQMYGRATFEDQSDFTTFSRPFQSDAFNKFDRSKFIDSIKWNQRYTEGGTDWELISIDYTRYRRFKVVKKPAISKVKTVMTTIIVDGKEKEVSEKALKAFLKTQV